jgi:hypothetical protein
MTVGEVVLESLTTGVITEAEVGWLASHQDRSAALKKPLPSVLVV